MDVTQAHTWIIHNIPVKLPLLIPKSSAIRNFKHFNVVQVSVGTVSLRPSYVTRIAIKEIACPVTRKKVKWMTQLLLVACSVFCPE